MPRRRTPGFRGAADGRFALGGIRGTGGHGVSALKGKVLEVKNDRKGVTTQAHSFQGTSVNPGRLIRLGGKTGKAHPQETAIVERAKVEELCLCLRESTCPHVSHVVR